MSTTTENLNLFKYDPIQDAKKTFNIQQALNNNWDKIDNMTPTKANTSLDNLTDEGKAKFDGQWMPSNINIFNKIKLNTTYSTFNLDFLPNNDMYEITFTCLMESGSNSSYVKLELANIDETIKFPTGINFTNIYGSPIYPTQFQCFGNIIIYNKKIKARRIEGGTGNEIYSLSTVAYRKLGTGFEAISESEET